MTLEYILRAAVHAMIYQGRKAHCYRAHVPGEGYVNDGTFRTFGTRADYLRQLKRSAQSEIESMGYAQTYAEPGYTQPKRGVVWANWNVLPRGLDSILERAGYAVEWADEWTTCSDCYRAIRTEPDGYDWKPGYVIERGDFLCLECGRAGRR
jgi:hypothetical protein